MNMAQMHQIGVLQRGPNMLWTCRWNEGGKESSISYEIQKNPYDNAMKVRFKYRVLAEPGQPEKPMDYTVPIKTSRSYKGKTWYWFVCPLIINGKACKRRVRNLYFLPNSTYFGCKHCRDMMMRSLPVAKRTKFRQTDHKPPTQQPKGGNGSQKQRQRNQNGSAAGSFMPDLKLGWRPAAKREVCAKCGCLTEGFFCCNCGTHLEDGAPSDNFFEILGATPAANEQELRVAFITRLKEYHPDRVAHLGPKLRKVAEQEIKNINEAYEILSDPKRREEYLRDINK